MPRVNSPLIKSSAKELCTSSDDWVTLEATSEDLQDCENFPPSPQPVLKRRRPKQKLIVEDEPSPPSSPILTKRQGRTGPPTNTGQDLPSPEIQRRAQGIVPRHSHSHLGHLLDIEIGRRAPTPSVKLDFDRLLYDDQKQVTSLGKPLQPEYVRPTSSSTSKESSCPNLAVSTFIDSGNHPVEPWQLSRIDRPSSCSTLSSDLRPQAKRDADQAQIFSSLGSEGDPFEFSSKSVSNSSDLGSPAYLASTPDTDRRKQIFRVYPPAKGKKGGAGTMNGKIQKNSSLIRSTNEDSSAKHLRKKSPVERLEDSCIVIDADENEQSKEKKRKVREPSSSAKKLCQYPEESSRSTVIVTTEDYKSLEESEFINDVIIDFYLTYLHKEVLNMEDRDNVYVFSTFFYPCLTKKPAEKNSLLSKDMQRYKRVERWTKNMDLFSKDMIIFPICHESHWFLLIAVKPGLIEKPENPEDRVTRGKPFMILLDSMDGSQEKAVTTIRKYLSCEYAVKRGGCESFAAKEMPLLKPRKPVQTNSTDCGVFLLHYVEKMFHSIAQFFWSNLPDLSNWFEQEEVDRKRFELATHIQNLAKSQNNDTDIPKIKLYDGTSRRRRSNRRRGRMLLGDDVFIPDESEYSPDGQPSPRKYRKSKRQTSKSNECLDIFGQEEAQKKAVATYKIPRRSNKQNKKDENSSCDPEMRSRKDADPRIENPAAIETGTFYGNISPKATRGSPKKSTESRVSDTDKQKFNEFIQNKVREEEDFRQNSDKENFKKFLDRSYSCSSPSSVGAKSSAEDDAASNHSDRSTVFNANKALSEVVHVNDTPELDLTEAPDDRVDSSSPELIENNVDVSRRSRDSGSGDSVEMLSNSDQSRKFRSSRPRGCKTGVPRIVIDPDFDDDLEVFEDIKEDRRTKLSRKQRIRPARNRSMESIDDKINRLTPGSSVPHIFSPRYSNSDVCSSEEDFQLEGKKKIGDVPYTGKLPDLKKYVVVRRMNPDLKLTEEKPIDLQWKQFMSEHIRNNQQ